MSSTKVTIEVSREDGKVVRLVHDVENAVDVEVPECVCPQCACQFVMAAMCGIGACLTLMENGHAALLKSVSRLASAAERGLDVRSDELSRHDHGVG